MTKYSFIAGRPVPVARRMPTSVPTGTVSESLPAPVTVRIPLPRRGREGVRRSENAHDHVAEWRRSRPRRSVRHEPEARRNRRPSHGGRPGRLTPDQLTPAYGQPTFRIGWCLL